MKDCKGNEIKVGSYVMLLEARDFWFEHEPKESYEILQRACKIPIEVFDIYDGKVTVELPATKDHEGEMVGNSISITPDKVEVVESL